MNEKTIPDIEEVLAITDPGEVGRENHGLLDRLVINFGNVVAWAFPILMLAIVSQVVLRSSGFNQAWLDDLQWWIYGFAMVTAFAYAITTNSHVRVDILYQNFSPEKKARVEVGALGWLLMPFLALMFDVLLHYAWQSIVAGEGSSSPNGLHHVYLLKGSLPVLFALAMLATWAALMRNLDVFSRTTLDKQLIWMFPAAVFIGWRIVHYIGYWVIYLTNDEIVPRRITREPFFEHALTISFVGIVALTLLLSLRNRGKEV